MTTNERWILSEFRVARDRLSRFPDENLVAQQVRTPFAEVDLIFERAAVSGCRGSLVIVEVKSCGDLWARRPLTFRQQSRLERARLYLETRTGRSVELVLATVDARSGAVSHFDFPL